MSRPARDTPRELPVLLSVEDLAAALRCSLRTAYRVRDALPTVFIGGRRLVRREVFKKHLATIEQPPKLGSRKSLRLRGLKRCDST